MKNTILLVLTLPLLLCAARPSSASAIQIGSAAALGANDFFDWGQIRAVDSGGNAVAQPSPVNVASNLGRAATITDGVSFTGLVQDTDWFGDFLPGENVLYSGDPNDPFGAANAFAVSLGVFNVAGTMSGLSDGSAPFLGARSDASNITRAVFTLTSGAGAGLGANRLLTADGRPSPPSVPEPATFALLALAAGGALGRSATKPGRKGAAYRRQS